MNRVPGSAVPYCVSYGLADAEIAALTNSVYPRFISVAAKFGNGLYAGVMRGLAVPIQETVALVRYPLNENGVPDRAPSLLAEAGHDGSATVWSLRPDKFQASPPNMRAALLQLYETAAEAEPRNSGRILAAMEIERNRLRIVEAFIARDDVFYEDGVHGSCWKITQTLAEAGGGIAVRRKPFWSDGLPYCVSIENGKTAEIARLHKTAGGNYTVHAGENMKRVGGPYAQEHLAWRGLLTVTAKIMHNRITGHARVALLDLARRHPAVKEKKGFSETFGTAGEHLFQTIIAD